MGQLNNQSANAISGDHMVVTSTYVMDEKLPVLLVSHEDDEEGGSLWQFHCGNGDYDMEKMLLVRFDTVLSLDPSLKNVVNLQKGKTITRKSRTSEWQNL